MINLIKTSKSSNSISNIPRITRFWIYPDTFALVDKTGGLKAIGKHHVITKLKDEFPSCTIVRLTLDDSELIQL